MQDEIINDKIIEEGITFDDVLLIPQASDILPRDASLKTRLTKNISINVPIVSAAMDTITEHEMAIALAREGCMGVIHKNMSIVEQAEAVDKVKRSESGMITNPITLKPSNNVNDAEQLMRKYKISGIPIIDEHNKSARAYIDRYLCMHIQT